MIKTQGGIRKSGVLSPWRNPYDPTDRFYRPVSAITRAILNFNGTQYGESAETYSILPGDDFEVDVIVASPGEGAAYDVAAWISMTENTESGKALHVGRRDGDKVTMSFWGDDLNVDLTGQIDWSQINRFTFSYDGTTRTQTIKLNGVDVGSNARVSDVNISTAKILINKFRTVVGSGSYFSITAAINGESIVNYRFDEPDTSYQRNYASAITDPNDPDWSGAILQNVLPGDWEEITQASGQTDWRGITYDISDPNLWESPDSPDLNMISSIPNGLRLSLVADGEDNSLTAYTSSGVVGFVEAGMSYEFTGKIYNNSPNVTQIAYCFRYETGGNETQVLPGETVDARVVLTKQGSYNMNVVLYQRYVNDPGSYFDLTFPKIARIMQYAEGAL